MTNPNTPCDLKKCHDLEQPWTNWRFHHENIGEYHVYNNFIRGYNGGFTVQSSTNGDAAHAQLGFKHVVIICNQRIMDFGSVWNFVAVKSHVFPWKSQVFFHLFPRLTAPSQGTRLRRRRSTCPWRRPCSSGRGCGKWGVDQGKTQFHRKHVGFKVGDFDRKRGMPQEMGTQQTQNGSDMPWPTITGNINHCTCSQHLGR